MDALMILGAIIAIALIVVAISFIVIWNKLSRAIVKINEADSDIDVALMKRRDMLVKQIEIVKSFTKHESETFEKVVELRKGMSLAEKTAAVKNLDEVQKGITLTAEAYPELRSSDVYRTLQISVNDAEEHLQGARRAFNSCVSIYNQMIVSFPASVVASLRGLKQKEFFDAGEIGDVEIKL